MTRPAGRSKRLSPPSSVTAQKVWRAEIKKAAKAVWITWKQMRFSSI
jgi:hypothetical protein